MYWERKKASKLLSFEFSGYIKQRQIRIDNMTNAKGDLSFGRGYTKQKGCSIGELLNM